jgi:hypothetical protein
MDGRGSYSDIRAVEFVIEALSFTVLNNPVTNGTLQVRVNTSAMLSLYSSEGRLLWNKEVDAGTETIDVSGYAKGIYLLKTNKGSVKILVQ